MKRSQFKKGAKVMDSWYADYGIGTITKVLKTRIHIDFNTHGKEVYDFPHATKFLICVQNK